MTETEKARLGKLYKANTELYLHQDSAIFNTFAHMYDGPRRSLGVELHQK